MQKKRYLKSRYFYVYLLYNFYIMPGKKKRARSIRDTKRVNPNQTESTHVMEWGQNPNPSKKRFKYEVNPTIFPEKDGSWTDLGGKGLSAYNEASKRGEVFEFSSKRRAEKFAAGSWKKGEARREAMRDYRQQKRDYNLPIKNKSIDKLSK